MLIVYGKNILTKTEHMTTAQVEELMAPHFKDYPSASTWLVPGTFDKNGLCTVGRVEH